MLLQSKRVLLALGQNATVSTLCQTYLIAYMPGVYLQGLCDLEKRFMNNIGKNILPMIAFTFATILHPIWVYIFMVKLDLKLYGIGIAGTITNLLTYGMMQYLL